MPRPGPRRANTAVRLDETTIASLDRRAARRGVKRSDIIRDAIESWLAQPDGDCQHCGGSGCVACDARHLPGAGL